MLELLLPKLVKIPELQGLHECIFNNKTTCLGKALLITLIKVIQLNKSNVPWPSKFLGWCCCCCCLSCFVFVFHLPSLSIEHHLLQLIPSKGVSLSWASLSPRREIFNHFLPTLKIANKGWKLHTKAENCKQRLKTVYTSWKLHILAEICKRAEIVWKAFQN